MPEGGRRLNVWLSNEEIERLENICQETGKKKSEVLKESLYRERDVVDAAYANAIFQIGLYLSRKKYDDAMKEVKKYADNQIRKRNR